MKKRKTLIGWIAGTVAVLILLAGLLLLIGPRLIDSDAAKQEIADLVSRKTGGRVHYTRADLSLFPHPRVVLHGAGISLPGRLTAEIACVTLYPKIGPLLAGRIEIARLIAQTPHITIHLPSYERAAAVLRPSWDLKTADHTLTTSLSSAVTHMEGLFLQVRDGRITLADKGKEILEAGSIQLTVDTSQAKPAIGLTGESTVCREISLKARLDPVTRKARAQVHLKGLRPHLLPDALTTWGPVKIGDGETGLSLALQADLGKGGIVADYQGSALPFTLLRGGNKADFSGVQFRGTLEQRKDALRMAISRLHLDRPGLDLTGEINLSGQTPQVRLHLEAMDVDVPAVRETVLGMAGAVPGMKKVFDVVRGGRVPRITIRSQADSVADLGDVNRLVITGRMQGGRIFVPQTGMDLADVSGDATVSNGVLTGARLQARLGKAQGSDGTLRVGLSGHDPAFYLDMGIEADLREALPIVRGLVADPWFKRELDRIDRIEGSAAARLVLGPSTQTMTARVAASQFDFTARHRAIPYPIRARGGRLSYETDVFTADRVDITVGRSSITRLSGRWRWRGDPVMDTEAENATIFLGELHPWIASMEGAKDALKELRRLEGGLLLTNLSANGPLLHPSMWRFHADARVRNVNLVYGGLPGPLTIHEGSLKADTDTLRFAHMKLGLLDARFTLSGRATGYLAGLTSLETHMNGEAGEEAVQEFSEIVGLPRGIRPGSPMTVSSGHVSWSRDADTSFAGEMQIPRGPRISFKGSHTPGFLKIESFHLADEPSEATLQFSRGPDALSFGFTGHLTKTSLDALLVDNRLLTGWIQGDLWARIVPESPIEWTIQGNLEGGDIDLSDWDLPAEVTAFSLQAAQQRLKVRSDIVALDDRRIRMDADVDMSEQGILFRLDLNGDGIDLDRTQGALQKLAMTPKGRARGTGWSVPIKGTAHVQLDRLVHGPLEWRPFACDITSEGNTVRIAVREAVLCNISTPATIEISPEKTTLHAIPDARGQDLAQAIACLTQETMKISGTFDFKGDLKGQGTEADLVRSLKGPIQFTSHDGRIDRFRMLTTIFSLLNVTEIFSGQLPDLRNQGFAYHSMTLDGHLADGCVHIDEALLDAPSMNMAATGHIDLLKQELDLTVFAAPFKTADRIIRMLPVIGYILDDTLVSIAVKVSGDLKNPKVDYLPASMLGSDLLGIFKRTLKAPLKVLTPVLPK
jgi:hypothetical protein